MSDALAADKVNRLSRSFVVGALSMILMFSIPFCVRKIDSAVAPLLIFPLVAAGVGYGASRYGCLTFRWMLGVSVVNSVIMAMGFAFIETFKPTPFHPFSVVRILIQVCQYFVFQGFPYVAGGFIGRAMSQRQLGKPVNVTD